MTTSPPTPALGRLAEPIERRARRAQRRALIKVGYSCNDHCVFCHTDDYRHSGDATTGDVLRKIDLAWRRHFDMVVFSGGEATIRPDLFKLTAHVRRRGLLLGFITNARVLSYRHVVERLLRDNLRYVHLSLHGTRRIHNKSTGDRSFEQTFAGLRNLTGRGLDLTVNCVVTRVNLEHLRELVDLVAPFDDIVLKFSCCEPKGAALRHGDPVVAPVSEAAEAAADAIRYGMQTYGAEPARYALENFPHCLVGPLAALDDDLLANRLLVMSEVWDDDLVDIDDFNKVKPPACAGCAHYDRCPGLFVEYVRQRGDGEVRPVRGVPASRRVTAFGVPALGLDQDVPAGFRPPEQARVDRHPRYPDAALVTMMVPRCDLACVFCGAAPGDAPVRFSTLHGVRAALRAMAPHARAALLTGGEPTAVDWLPDVLAAARELGYERVQMQSHCGRAADAGYARRLVDAGLTAVDVPLYGATPSAHQSVTRTRASLKRTLQGLDNLRELGVRVVVHTTLFRETLAHLSAWWRFVQRLRPDGVYIQLPGDTGVPGAWQRLAPSLEAAGAVLERVLADAAPPFPLLVSDVPACVVPSLRRFLPSAHPPRRGVEAMLVPYGEWLAVFTGGATRGFAPQCATCAVREECEGVPREYAAADASVLRPLGEAQGAA